MTRFLKRSFFERDTLTVAPELLGKEIIFNNTKLKKKKGVIVEVEAYTKDDPACHASKGVTKRNEPMFGPGGYSYIYFIYGMYFCLNFITEVNGVPGAVLIRALEIPGNVDERIASGPGKLCMYLNITKDYNKVDCCDEDSPLVITKANSLKDFSIVQTKRVGISHAKEYPWRWYVEDNRSVSKLI